MVIEKDAPPSAGLVWEPWYVPWGPEQLLGWAKINKQSYILETWDPQIVMTLFSVSIKFK